MLYNPFSIYSLYCTFCPPVRSPTDVQYLHSTGNWMLTFETLFEALINAMKLSKQVPVTLQLKDRVMESIILEIAGPAVICCAAFGVTSFLSISKIDRRLSNNTNTLYFCAIPVLVYAAFRVYFLFLYRLTSVGKLSQSRPLAGAWQAKTCNCGTLIYSYLLENSSISLFFSTMFLLARAAIVLGSLVGVYIVIKIVPSTQESFQLLYDQVWWRNKNRVIVT